MSVARRGLEPSACDAPQDETTDRDAGAEKGEWTAAGWLDGIPSLNELLASAMTGPLGEEPEPGVQLKFIRAVGKEVEAWEGSGDGADADELGASVMLTLLRRGSLLERLAAELWRATRDLYHARAATARELQAKFLEESDVFTLSYGGLDTFFGGLEGLLGPPSPQLTTAMLREHCHSEDSAVEFTTSNYGITTTSQIEYHFVFDP